MAYSDYGGYAYRNGERVIERSDCTIQPDGTLYGTPGAYPGFAMLAQGVEHAEVLKRINWPKGHAVMGDGPIFVALYKQSGISIFHGAEPLDTVSMLRGHPEAVRSYTQEGGKTSHYIEDDFFRASGTACVLETHGHRIEVRWTNEDNYYQYVRMEQPDGVEWHAWSGYGVGAGLEECGYGYSTPKREAMLCEFWPNAIKGAA